MTTSNEERSPEDKELVQEQLDRVVAIQENDSYELSEWENTFMKSVKYRLTKYQNPLTEKQLNIIAKIEAKIEEADKKEKD